jgi:hypothetical protein
MRMFVNIRDCFRWVQEEEVKGNKIYDNIVRLRDDAYAFGPWVMDNIEMYKSTLVTAGAHRWLGVNDHDFSVARSYADLYLRGPAEDYYLKYWKTGKLMKYSTEIYLLNFANHHKIPVETIDVCKQPFIPLRGMKNSTHYKIHEVYANNILRESAKLSNASSNCFHPEWKRLISRWPNNYTVPMALFGGDQGHTAAATKRVRRKYRKRRFGSVNELTSQV